MYSWSLKIMPRPPLCPISLQFSYSILTFKKLTRLLGHFLLTSSFYLNLFKGNLLNTKFMSTFLLTFMPQMLAFHIKELFPTFPCAKKNLPLAEKFSNFQFFMYVCLSVWISFYLNNCFNGHVCPCFHKFLILIKLFEELKAALSYR